MVTKTKIKQTLDVKTQDTSKDLVAQNTLFDYSSLDDNTAKLAKESAIEIKAREKAIWENIIEIGNRLIEVKTALPHGSFEKWCEFEFKWSAVIARKYMTVSSELKNETQGFDFFPNSLKPLYALASGLANSDEETKEEILTAVESKTEEKGKALTEKEIKEITKPYLEQIEELKNQQTNLLKDLEKEKSNTDWQAGVIREFNLKGDVRIKQLEDTVSNQNKQIQELNSAISQKENSLIQLESQKADLNKKQEELNELIAKEANVLAQQTLEKERQPLLKKEAELKKKQELIESELSEAKAFKVSAQRQQENLNTTTQWLDNFQLTNEYLGEITVQLKSYKNNLQNLPNLAELSVEDRSTVEAQIKALIVDFNDNLHSLGGAINYLNGAVVKFNNDALKVIEAEVKNG